MAWEKEAEALERSVEMMAAVQKEFIAALLRVAEQYDADPTHLAMNVSNMMNSVFAPLHAERMQQQHRALIREEQERREAQEQSDRSTP
jgi:hypothetical protein